MSGEENRDPDLNFLVVMWWNQAELTSDINNGQGLDLDGNNGEFIGGRTVGGKKIDGDLIVKQVVANISNNEKLIMSLKELEVNDKDLMTNDGDIEGNTSSRQPVGDKKVANKNKRNKRNQVELNGRMRKTNRFDTRGSTGVSGKIIESMKRVIGGMYEKDKKKYGVS